MKKKVMFLGANMVQTPAVRLAKSLGYTVITCDYLPDNPGHKYGDKYINISTVDMEAVLHAAASEKIDGIISFASDVSAPSAAYAAEKLGLAGHPFESVEILTHKDRFRAFLLEHGFPCPQSKGYDNVADAIRDWKDYTGALVVKPVDSSGSKGVRQINHISELEEAVKDALCFSRSRRFIVETFVEMEGAQIIGDGFSVDGKLVFSLYGDHIFNSASGGQFAVQGGMFPLDCSERGADLKERVDREVQKVLTILQMRSGAYNIEARLGKDHRIYLMEIGPRNGGNMIPELIRYATGVDLTRYTIEAALGNPCGELCHVPANGYWSYYVIHSGKSGVFDGLQIQPDFQTNNLVECYMQVDEGTRISKFSNASAAIGVAICRFRTRSEMIALMKNIEELIKVKISK